MALLINGDIVVIYDVRDQPIAGYVFISDDQGSTINQASVDQSGRIQFLHKDNIVLPIHSIRTIEKLHPRSSPNLMSGSRVDVTVSPDDSQRVIDWFESKGVALSRS